MYRDGVGDGQLAVVQDYEVRQIVESFTDFGADYHPKLTVVVVQKRINTRLFQQVSFWEGDWSATCGSLDQLWPVSVQTSEIVFKILLAWTV